MGRKKKAPDIRLPKIEQLPSGAWHTRVLVDGRRVSITKDSYEECVAEYLGIKNKVVDAQEKKGGKSITLEEAENAYIAAREGFASPSTIRGYNKFKRNMFQGMMRKNVFSATDDQWQEAIRREHRRGMSPKYIKNAWSFVASSIEEAGAKRPEVMLYPREDYERPFLDPDEIDKFVAAVNGTDVEIPALLCLSSLRRSEILALTWDNVDLKNNAIYIRGAAVVGDNGLVKKPQNKSKKSRRPIPIIQPLAEALEKVEKKKGPVVLECGDTVLRKVKTICRAAGVTAVDLHGLRHSYASLAYHLGIPAIIAAEIGGWEDIATMEKIYTHIAQKDIAKRSKDFCDFFSSEEVKKRKIGNGDGNKK